MKMFDSKSLAATIDAVNEVFFFDKTLSKTQREQVAKFLVSRQGIDGSYANMFAPTQSDYSTGINLFTGEKITSRAATAHILGEEACRALILLDVKTKNVKNALKLASDGILKRIR